MPTASLRAPDGYNIPKAMKTTQDTNQKLFDKFGGHPCAAGFSADPTNLPQIQKSLEEQFALQEQSIRITKKSNSNFRAYNFEPKIQHLQVELSQLTPQFIQEIMALDPFGQDFKIPELVFELNNTILQSLRFLGDAQKHFKLTSGEIEILYFNCIETDILVFETAKKLLVSTKPTVSAWKNQIKYSLIINKYFL